MDNNDNIIIETQMGNDINLNNKSRKKKFIIIGLLAFIVVLTITIITGLLITRNAYKEPIENFFDANFNGKEVEIEGFAPDEYWDYAAKRLGVSKKEAINIYNDKYKEFFQAFHESINQRFFVDVDKPDTLYIINNKTKLNKKSLSKIREDLEECLSIDAKSVKKAYRVKVDFANELKDMDEAEIIVVKIRNGWYILSYDPEKHYSNNYGEFIIETYSKLIIDFPEE